MKEREVDILPCCFWEGERDLDDVEMLITTNSPPPLNNSPQPAPLSLTQRAADKTEMSKPNFALKITINKQKTKVLFAEADSDFTDILFSFLTLPLGKIVKLLDDHQAPPVGSLSNLYASVTNLGDEFFNGAAKLMLLNPRSSFEDVCPNLKLDIADTKPTHYFTCNSDDCDRQIRAENICMYYGSGRCDNCRGPLLTEMSIVDTKDSDGGGFTIKTALFSIRDDLRVEPYARGFLQTLKNLDIEDENGTELRNVTFGIDEIIGLLKRCLLSETPLTDLILNQTHKLSSVTKQSNPNIPLKSEKTESGNSKRIILQIIVQKSTNRLLFAVAEADFVELLFSFLTLPLGGVESLLENNTWCKNVDNLYRSLSSLDAKYFRAPDLKSRLMNPKLAPGYSSRKQFLPLTEETAPTLYIENENLYYRRSWFDDPVLVRSLNSPKGLDNYVKESTTYMVTDDLTVMPFCMTSGLTILDRLNVSLCDVDELELHIGMEEVLGILKASLTSTCALSSGLINRMADKLPKLEH